MASEIGALKFPMSEAVSRLTINVKITGMRRFRVRMAVARVFIFIIGKIIGTRIKIDIEIEG